ncbi:MAG: hypothetical protein ACK52I_20895 [Pseudomonadota bacterium]|jgi:hypothetical protein|uniref:hypothetical protein n=1 Tax=Silanimonas sp. TaxID=1929290 RepID=UPI0022BFFC2C|nr:hypothetical protein [Silanimonas sp.]MCZ8116014.1 hypothetical protein [Silanimonas sp.]
MKPLALAALSLLLFTGAASASITVPRVDAVADPLASAGFSVSCDAPNISASAMEAVFGPHDLAKAIYLELGLARAIDDACAQKVARIVVTRQGTLVSWAPASDADAAVAIALR